MSNFKEVMEDKLDLIIYHNRNGFHSTTISSIVDTLVTLSAKVYNLECTIEEQRKRISDLERK